jgi:hypothetical protein
MDQPGIVAGISTLLAKDNCNISFMTVGRTGKNMEAIMAIGIDQVRFAMPCTYGRLTCVAMMIWKMRPILANILIVSHYMSLGAKQSYNGKD